MKKFEVFFSVLFIIGLIGVLSLVFFTDKPLENYFAASLVSVIVMLPKILLVFFMSVKKIIKHFVKGLLELMFFYFVFVGISSWFFPFVNRYSFVCVFITIIFYFWGLIYYRKKEKETEKKEFLKLMSESTGEQQELEDVEGQFIFEGMFLLPGSEKDFVVKEKFRLSQVRYEGVPKIGYIGPNFVKHFMTMAEPGQPKRSLNKYQSDADFNEVSFFVWAGDHFVYLQDIWETMILYERGYWLSDNNKVLDADGMFNIFPVKKPGNGMWFIVVSIETTNNTWEIEAYQKLTSLTEKKNIYSEN